MKKTLLIAEQVKYLRARRKELEDRYKRYHEYCGSRESTGMEGIGLPHFTDFQEEISYSHARKEREYNERLLSTSEFVTERNFDQIDIGTGFYVDFGDGKVDRTILIDANTTTSGAEHVLATTDSDFGKAVIGHKEGDTITYKVAASGRVITATITEIDRMKENYTHFIREQEYTDRVSSTAKKELRNLKITDPTEYRRRHAITPSQLELLREELGKLASKDHTARRTHINRIIEENEIALPKKENRVQVGSLVDIILTDGDQSERFHFEMINRAVSTEIDSDYVERISTLGTAIYGLKVGDEFSVRRNHKPSLKGRVIGIDNQEELKRVR